MLPLLVLSAALLASPASCVEEWAVCIPKGREAAERFAGKNGLDLAGEVIAGSNCFQFYRSSRRGRRSVVGDITPRIIDDEDVVWAEKQEALVSGRWIFFSFFFDYKLNMGN